MTTTTPTIESGIVRNAPVPSAAALCATRRPGRPRKAERAIKQQPVSVYLPTALVEALDGMVVQDKLPNRSALLRRIVEREIRKRERRDEGSNLHRSEVA